MPDTLVRRGEHPGGEAEDRADVDVLARARGAPGPVVAPAGERAEHGHQLARALGQLVVHARRHLAVALAGEQAVGHHAVQARAQLLGRDAGQHALQLDEAARAGGQIADDQQRPLVADEVEGASVRRPLVVWMALGGRDWGHYGTSPNRRSLDGRRVGRIARQRGIRFDSVDIWRIDTERNPVDTIRKFPPGQSLKRAALDAARVRGNTSKTKDEQMGDVIRLAERRAARRTRNTPQRTRRRGSSSCSTSVVRSRTSPPSGSSARSTTWCGRRRALTSLTLRLGRGDPDADARRAAASPPSSARASCGCRSCGPSATPLRCPPRCARPPTRPSRAAARRSCSRPAGSRSAAASTSTTRRSSPRRPRRPASAWTAACRRSATSRATARSKAPGGTCWPPAPTGCRRCGSGVSLFWGENRVAEAAAAARHAGRAGCGPRLSLRRDEARQDAGVDLLHRVLRLRRGSRGGSGPRGRTRAAAARGPRQVVGARCRIHAGDASRAP